MMTDYMIAGVLAYFFITGWKKGLLRALLGPISLVMGCLIAYIYYQQTQNIAISLVICVLSPFVIKILISIILTIWKKILKNNTPLSIPSKLLGSLFSLLWCGSYIVLMLISISLLPIQNKWFKKIQEGVVASKSYTLIQKFMENTLPATSDNINNLAAIVKDPKKLKQLQSTKEFETLQEDKYLNEIFSDEVLVEQLNKKEYGKLLGNQKFQSLLQNEDLLKKLFALNKKIMEEEFVEVKENPEVTSQPKVINIK